MTDIRFYHLTRKTLEQVLPELLEKTLERGWRAVVMTGSAEKAEDLADVLWQYNPNHFLPHGTEKDGFAEDQPIWITEKEENPNKATVLFLTDGAKAATIAAFDIVCEIFNGHDEVAVKEARTRWKKYKEDSHKLSYWQQNENGWSKEA